MPWPLTIETTSDTEQDYPESVSEFLTKLLNSEIHDLADSLKRTVKTLKDIKTLFTGSRSGYHHRAKGPHQNIVSYCLNYNLVCEAETSQAELIIQNSNHDSTFNDDINVASLIYWWANNFR